MKPPESRIYLSPPHLDGDEFDLVRDAFESNWIAPLGPHVDAFEREFAGAVECSHAAALSSGTAALHLSLVLLGVQSGDVVLCPTLTFAATAFAIRYVGAVPIFIDAHPETWTMDPALLEETLQRLCAEGKHPKAVLVVDLYGQSADWNAIMPVCRRYEVSVVEDAAEALGATYGGRSVGGFGKFGVFSFNGNKIITTSGGGMLVSNDGEAVAHARRLASQAREDRPYYEHREIGYNYRMSNLLAALGRGQLRHLAARVEARRRCFGWYEALLGDLPGIAFMPEAAYGHSSRWLTCFTVDEAAFGASAEAIRLALTRHNIEARPVWKPMHLQPVFQGCQVVAGVTSEALFLQGLCLPSGSALRKEDVERIAGIIRDCRRVEPV